MKKKLKEANMKKRNIFTDGFTVKEAICDSVE